MIYNKIKEYGIAYCLGTLEESFLKLLNMFNLPYSKLEAAQLRYGALRYPCLMRTADLEAKNPALIDQYRKWHAKKH